MAESCTGGLLADAIVSVPGASRYFLGGLVAYSLNAKVDLLHVDGQHAQSVDCVSQRVAEEMARGACRLFGARFSISTTGYADAGPDQVAHISFFDSLSGAQWTRTVPADGSPRNSFRARVVQSAMSVLPEFQRSVGGGETPAAG